MRRVAIAGLAAAMLAGCGGGDGVGAGEGAPPEPRPEAAPRAREATVAARSHRVLAQVRGEEGEALALLDARRTGATVVTVPFRVSVRADAEGGFHVGSLLGEGGTLDPDHDTVSGATLVDEDRGRKHFVLRDGRGRPLCSQGVDFWLEPGEQIDLFAKFPAPPAGTKSLAFAVPGFASIDGHHPPLVRRVAFTLAIGVLATPAVAEADVGVQPLRATVQDFERRVELQARAVRLIERGRDLAVELEGDTLFAFDSAALTPRARAALNETARIVEAEEVLRLVIEGHTDTRGSMAYNDRLSLRRAEAVASALREQLATQPEIEVRGRGECEPVASNAKAAGRQRNRRVEVRFVRSD